MWAYTIVLLAGGLFGWIMFDIVTEIIAIWKGK